MPDPETATNSGVIKCPSCKAENTAKTKFCGECGVAIAKKEKENKGKEFVRKVIDEIEQEKKAKTPANPTPAPEIGGGDNDDDFGNLGNW